VIRIQEEFKNKKSGAAHLVQFSDIKDICISKLDAYFASLYNFV
jgi:hypothetical protein